MSLETELHRAAGAMERLAAILEAITSTANHPVKLTITGAHTGGEATDKVATTPALVKAEAAPGLDAKTEPAPEVDGIKVNPEKIQKTTGEKIAKMDTEKTEVEPETPAQTAATDHDSPAADHEAELGGEYASLSTFEFMKLIKDLVNDLAGPRALDSIRVNDILHDALNEIHCKSFRAVPVALRPAAVQVLKAKLAEVKNG